MENIKLYFFLHANDQKSMRCYEIATDVICQTAALAKLETQFVTAVPKLEIV